MEAEFPSEDQQYAEADLEWTGEAGSAPVDLAKVRLIPDRFVTVEGTERLRATLLLLPDRKQELEWPARVCDNIAGLRLRVRADPDVAGTDADELVFSRTIKADLTEDSKTKSRYLWAQLVTDASGRKCPETDAVLAEAQQHPQLRGRVERLLARRAMLSSPEARILSATQVEDRPQPPPDRHRNYRIGYSQAVLASRAERPKEKPCHVASSRTSELDRELTALDAVRYLHSLGIDFSPPDDEKGSGKVFSPLALDIWSGAALLFQHSSPESGGEMPAPPPAAGSPPAQNSFVDENLQEVCTAIAQRGLSVAFSTSDKVNDELLDPLKSTVSKEIVNPFHRVTADPGPDDSMTATLFEAIKEERKGQIDRAIADYRSLGFVPPDKDGGEAPANSIAAAVKNAVNGSNLRISNHEFALDPNALAIRLESGLKDARAGFQRLLAAHLLATRPDAGFKKEPAEFFVDGERLTAADLDGRLRTIETADDRRHFGLLAFPALARVVKLIVDVEFTIHALPKWLSTQIEALQPGGAVRFFMTADFGKESNPPVWTACEVAWAGSDRRLFTPYDEAPHDHLHGTLNLNQPGRYDLGSMDVASRAEQMIHKGQSTSEAARSGASRDEHDLPARTSGIVLRDLARAAAVQGEIGRDDARNALVGKAVRLHAKDLVTGYRVDVAIAPRRDVATTNSNQSDLQSSWTWRSLCRRSMKFQPVACRDDDGQPYTVYVEELITRSLEAVGAGVGSTTADELRDQLEQASVRPASRVVPSKKQTLGGPESSEEKKPEEVIAIDTLCQWDGDPLGTSCSAGLDIPGTGWCKEEDLDLLYALDLPVTGERPPRLEFGREYRFGLRCTYAGGGGLRLDEAVPSYEHQAQPTALPRRTTLGKRFAFLRQERIAAPVPTMLHPRGRERPGDTLESLVVRRDDDGTMANPAARRILYVPGVPMAFAAAHPSPDPEGSGTVRRALDGPTQLGPRPLGGFLNVALDPKSGGLPVMADGIGYSEPADDSPVVGPDKGDPPSLKAKPQGIFRVRRSGIDDLLQRETAYYPDPAARWMAFQLWRRGDAPGPYSRTTLVEVYDANYRQDGPSRLEPDSAGIPCLYPHAMPILLELHRASPGQAAQILFNAADDTGSLDDDGDFRRLRPNRRAPEGSVTVRRVRVELPPGEEYDLRCWCLATEQDLDRFGGFQAAMKLLNKGELKKEIYHLAFQKMASQPVVEQAESLSLRLVHAVQRPERPSAPAPSLLRRTIAQEEWPVEATSTYAVPALWHSQHQIGAYQSWVGGSIQVDRWTTGTLALKVEYVDPRDEPGKPIPLRNSEFDFPRVGPIILPLRLNDPNPANGAAAIDLVHEGLKDAPLVLALPDARAYRLEITPVATSRFTSLLSQGPVDLARFSAVGPAVSTWAVATCRPDPMSYVELLPAFVWEVAHRGEQRVKRRMAVRLMWRRPRLSGTPDDRNQETVGGWYSSGADERLALIMRRPDQGLGDIGALSDFVTQWGADSIREAARRPSWTVPEKVFDGNLRHDEPYMEKAAEVWVPVPGSGDEDRGDPPPGPYAFKLDLLAFPVSYDEIDDFWYVDVDIDADADPESPGGAPWMRLGLVRYQEHAMTDQDPRRDLRVSRPAKIEFCLQPSRRVDLHIGRKTGGVWPVTIRVCGPLATVTGGADGVRPESIREQFRARSRPRFKATLLRTPLLLDGLGEGGDEVVAVMTSDDYVDPRSTEGMTPAADSLWSTTFYLERNPRRARHYVFIEEVDVMLSAHSNKEGEQLVESGPRFMAKIRLR